MVGREPYVFHDPDEVAAGLAVAGSPARLFLGSALKG
jgi:hypothetical protein